MVVTGSVAGDYGGGPDLFWVGAVQRHMADARSCHRGAGGGGLAGGRFCLAGGASELPTAAITLVGSGITIPGVLLCLLLAFAAGFCAWFVAWPAGRIFALYAVPTGLAIWAMQSGTMHRLLLEYHDAAGRQILYGALRWEGVFWLLVCAAGYLGVWVASKAAGTKIVILGQYDSEKPQGVNVLINVALAVAVTLAVTWFAVGFFAQDVHQPDPALGSVVGQPGNRQIAFGVFAAFCLAAYLVKYALKIGYLPVAAASALLSFFGATQLLRGDTRPFGRIGPSPLQSRRQCDYAAPDGRLCLARSHHRLLDGRQISPWNLGKPLTSNKRLCKTENKALLFSASII